MALHEKVDYFPYQCWICTFCIVASGTNDFQLVFLLTDLLKGGFFFTLPNLFCFL